VRNACICSLSYRKRQWRTLWFLASKEQSRTNKMLPPNFLQMHCAIRVILLFTLFRNDGGSSENLLTFPAHARDLPQELHYTHVDKFNNFLCRADANRNLPCVPCSYSHFDANCSCLMEFCSANQSTPTIFYADFIRTFLESLVGFQLLYLIGCAMTNIFSLVISGLHRVFYNFVNVRRHCLTHKSMQPQSITGCILISLQVLASFQCVGGQMVSKS
jgi:hypothetical protein